MNQFNQGGNPGNNMQAINNGNYGSMYQNNQIGHSESTNMKLINQASQGRKHLAPAREVTLSDQQLRNCEISCNIYSIIKALDFLEKAYVNGDVEPKDYDVQCKRLLAQYNTATDSMAEEYPGLRNFVVDFNLDACKFAIKRLDTGVSGYAIHNPGEDLSKGSAVVIAEVVQHIITARDSIEVKMTAVDQIQPVINDIVTSLNRLPNLPSTFTPYQTLKEWNIRLSRMKASDELSEEETRQLAFDLDNALTSFKEICKTMS